MKKKLYDLKQAPRAWYYSLDTYLHKKGFEKGNIDRNLYIKIEGEHMILVVVYVDDIIFGGNKKFLMQGICRSNEVQV